MRMYTKRQLTIVNGYLKAPDSSIVVPDPKIVKQANILETMLQKAEYLQAQPTATPMPSLDGFERKSIMDDIVPQFTVTTPMLDRKAEEAMALMEELDNIDTADNANQLLGLFAELFEFVKSDYLIDYGTGTELSRIDTPTLGDILELTEADVIDAVAKCSGLAKRPIEDEAKTMRDEDLDELRAFLDDLTKAAEDGNPNAKAVADTLSGYSKEPAPEATNEVINDIDEVVDRFVKDAKAIKATED